MEKLDKDDLYDLTRGFLLEAVTGRDLAQERRDQETALNAVTHLMRIVDGSRLPEHICSMAIQLKRAIDEHFGWGR